MGKEERGDQPDQGSGVREETAKATREAFIADVGNYFGETLKLLEKNDPDLARILQSPILLRKLGAGEDYGLGSKQRAEIALAGAFAWRLLYNEDPTLPPVKINTEGAEISFTEQSLESIALKDPHFANFILELEAETGMPKLFRLGATLVYSLKHPSAISSQEEQKPDTTFDKPTFLPDSSLIETVPTPEDEDRIKRVLDTLDDQNTDDSHQ